jgi:hypothetical protein
VSSARRGRAKGDGAERLGTGRGVAYVCEVADLPLMWASHAGRATDGPAGARVRPTTARGGISSMCLGAGAAWEDVEPREGAVSKWRGLGRRPGGSDAEGWRGTAR